MFKSPYTPQGDDYYKTYNILGINFSSGNITYVKRKHYAEVFEKTFSFVLRDSFNCTDNKVI